MKRYIRKPNTLASFHHIQWNKTKTELNRLDALMTLFKFEVKEKVYKVPTPTCNFSPDQIYCGIANTIFKNDSNTLFTNGKEVKKFLSQIKMKRLDLIRLCSLSKSLLRESTAEYSHRKV